MRGLLTKDFALLLQRKKTFFILAVWAVVMCLTMDGGSFVVGWMSVILAFFAISSITYDEYDNCFPFLMTLPISRNTYTLEKFLFGLLCGLGAWSLSAVLYFIFSAAKGSAVQIGSELTQLAVFIPVFMLLIDFSLPVNLKYGSERGRTIVLIIWGVGIFSLFAAKKLMGDVFVIDESALNTNTFVFIAFAISAVLTAISVLISIKIMAKKEF